MPGSHYAATHWTATLDASVLYGCCQVGLPLAFCLRSRSSSTSLLKHGRLSSFVVGICRSPHGRRRVLEVLGDLRSKHGLIISIQL